MLLVMHLFPYFTYKNKNEVYKKHQFNRIKKLLYLLLIRDNI